MIRRGMSHLFIPKLLSAIKQGFREYLRPPSLYDLLSLSTLALFLLITFSGWHFPAENLQTFTHEIVQRLNLDLVVPLQGRLTPLLHDTEEIRRELAAFERAHPRFRVFLLDQDGRVIVHTEGELQRTQLNKARIDELTRKGERVTPRLEGDPLNKDRLAVFSTSRISTRDHTWYLYAVMREDIPLSPSGKGSRTLKEHRTNLISLLCLALLLTQARIFTLSLASCRITPSDAPLPSQSKLSNLASSVEELAESAKLKAKQLKEIDEERSSLVTGSAGDLRATLEYMRPLLTSLRDPRDAPAVTEKLGRLSRAVDSVIKRISQILEITKYESIGNELHKEPFFAFDCLHDVQMQHSELSEKQQVKIKGILADDDLMVFGDIELIYEAYGRLVHNALSYSPPGSSVYLNALEDADQIHLTVEDEGIGLLQEDMPHLFQRLFRGANAQFHNPSGEGLGLYIAQKIARAHGGDVTLVPRPSGGTKATLSLPRKRAARLTEDKAGVVG